MNKPAPRSKVVISRHWHNPQIAVTVCSERIKLEVDLVDFCRALAAEMGHPLRTLTRAQLEESLVAAIEGALNKVKESSVHQP